MRELKFRVWNKTLHQYGHVALKKGVSISIVTDLEIEQYIGLKDKNGKEIYEGDILKDESNDTAVVIWREHQAEWGIKWIHIGIEDSLSHRMEWGNLNEVIGNINENPELLESKNVKD